MSQVGGYVPRYGYVASAGATFSGSGLVGYGPYQARTTDGERLLLFLIEMLAKEPERGLLYTCLADPADEQARLIYADYLDENGRTAGAAMLRNGWRPGGSLADNGALPPQKQ